MFGGHSIVASSNLALLNVIRGQDVYAEDIDFAKEGSGIAEEVLVKNARTRVRVNRLRNGQPTVRDVIWSRLGLWSPPRIPPSHAVLSIVTM